MSKQTKMLMTVATAVVLSGCGGGGGDSPTATIPAIPTTPTTPSSPTTPTAPVLLTAENSNAPSATYQGKKRPIVSNFSDINGVAGVQIILSSLGGGTLTIQCPRNGTPRYAYNTSSVTANGTIQYKIGRQASKIENWAESNGGGFRLLTPPSFDVNLIRAFYQNWEFKFQWNKFTGGSQIDSFNIEGFPIAIDETRNACGWDSAMFPPDNGWNQAMPNVPPADAKIATFTPGSVQEYRTIAWKTKNAVGTHVLLVRVGDRIGEGPCVAGTSGVLGVMGGTNFYVRQNGVLESAVSGSDEGYACNKPRLMVLQGKFDPEQPFTLEIYSFHYSSVEPEKPASLGQQSGPFAKVDF